VIDRGGTRWVTDTSVFTHLARAGHLGILERLTPNGILVVPSEVNTEIQRSQELHQGIPLTSSLTWVDIAVLTEEEESTFLAVKMNLGGSATQHLGESAVIAVARHRAGVALLDDRAATRQATRLGVTWVDTLWIVIEAYKRLFDHDRQRTIAVVDDLLETGMYLPVTSGSEIITYAYEEGWLPE
jgi:predicted nucleic acid-binding protein